MNKLLALTLLCPALAAAQCPDYSIANAPAFSNPAKKSFRNFGNTLLAGIYKPSAGQARITGRLSALLNPASGMDQESTGIENIFLRGYLMGLTKAEIDAHVDEICAFSELGEYVHLPVRTYSAGMFARLAFSISTILRSDIMLIDEGIGAGDAAFFSRAQQKIETMLESTSIVILASHAPSLINRFCNRLIRMDSGRIIEDGPVVPE